MLKRTTTLWLAVMIGLASVFPAQAQVVDPRVQQLEEQVRRLNGMVEELNFQMLQMQDQMRRMQEDNEFRLQQLEESRQGALPGAGDGPAVAGAAEPAPEKTARVEPQPTPSEGTPTAPPPGNLGTLTLDGSGSVTGAEIDFSTNAIERALDENSVASVTLTGGPEAVYEEGYRHVLNGDYAQAEAVFERFVSVYPQDGLTADARFWLGESMLAQGRFEEALDVFIDTRTLHPDGSKGPETMLKIGTIMAALGDRNIACVTFADALQTFETMRPQTRSAIEGEYAKASC